MADGSRLAADLVIGTDGAGSAVRNSLTDLTQERKKYSDGVCRVLIPRPAEFRGERWNRVLDYWTLEPDAMRVLYHPMGPDMLYIAFMAETKNERASRIRSMLRSGRSASLTSSRLSSWPARPREAARQLPDQPRYALVDRARGAGGRRGARHVPGSRPGGRRRDGQRGRPGPCP